MLVSVAVHLVLLLFLVAPVKDIAAESEEPTVVIPLVPPIPPPPPEVVRPAEPIAAALEVDEEITISPTELEDVPLPAGPPAPAPPATPEIEPPEFFAYTQPPRCREKCSGEAILAHLPPVLRRSGLMCDLVLGLRIDTAGAVVGTRVLASSGNRACDAAAEAWGGETVWTTAYNRDQPVEVWIAQPVRIRTE